MIENKIKKGLGRGLSSLLGDTTAITHAMIRPILLIWIVFIAPILSSRNPKQNAPSPAVRLRTIPNTMISESVKSKTLWA